MLAPETETRELVPTKRLAGALVEMAGAVLILDEDGCIEYANDSARSLLASGGTRAPLIGVPFQAYAATGSGDRPPQADLAQFSAYQRLTLSRSRTVECNLQPLSSGGWVVNLSDVSSQQKAVEAAQRDPLTGLANRSTFRKHLLSHLQDSNSPAVPFAVLCLDLDHFKAINDSLGHPIGDALLLRVADRLRSAVRECDLVARLGGDEFAIIQINPPLRGTEALAKRLVDLVGRSYVVEGNLLNVGVSVGIALAPTDGDDPDKLLKHADLALYRAKSVGRGTHRFFEPSMDDQMQARRALEIDLRKALALKEFRLVYQPQIHLETGKICGFEALIRWHHPTRGLVSPADFIPLAEEIGLIGPIGEWVLRTACKDAASWNSPVGIAVNLSPLQFRNPKLAAVISKTLSETGLAPGRLELEITEGALIENTDSVLAILHQVRALGVRISMDDFGTGYSSLSYLQKFPFDKIKIDRSFVQGMTTDMDCRAIVRAVASLGASLGMETVAEGVETREQLEHIREEGCDKVQGYLTGRPTPPETAAALASSAAADGLHA
jgi:diguanylate cyclase (GGDEF)-like protein